MTQVVVRADDPAFSQPTKPIGPFFSEGRARRLADARGWAVAEDSGRGWRRVVASPEPVEVVEAQEIRGLLDAGEVVVACGGRRRAGDPRRETTWCGVDAVIDKDFAAALIGRLVGATSLLLLTGVEQVLLDFGTPRQRAVDTITVDEARAHLADGQFPAGSMGPKVEAAIQFVEAGGRERRHHLARARRRRPGRRRRHADRRRDGAPLGPHLATPERGTPCPPRRPAPAPCSRTRRASATT